MIKSLRLPDFIIAGAAKSATTWLQKSLQQSPSIVMPDHEPHFFARHYHEGIEAYLAELGSVSDGVLLGEKSNSYLTVPEAAARIRMRIPDVRLIFQLRNPVDRAYSDYTMLFRRGEVDSDIWRHLDPDRAAGQRFLRDGCYADHLQRFYDLFPANQILVLLYEDMLHNPQGQLRCLARHLGQEADLAPPLETRVKDARAAAVPQHLRRILGPVRPVLDPIRHTSPMLWARSLVARSPRYPEFNPDLRAKVITFYQPQARILQRITGQKFDIWKLS